MAEKITLNRHDTDPSREELLNYGALPSSMDEFAYFNDIPSKRLVEQKRFLSGEKRLPNFYYQRLDRIYDDFQTGDMKDMSHEERFVNLLDMKGSAYKAIGELDHAAETGIDHAAEYTMYADMQEKNLNLIRLVESAERLREDNSDLNRLDWRNANERCYGVFRPDYFQAILDGSYKEIFNSTLLSELKKIVETKYASELSAVPNTPDDIYYDSRQIETICNQAIINNGMAAAGVAVEIDNTVTNANYSRPDKKLLLPPDLHRNAAETRRLIIHELRHAERNLNGIKTGVPLLAEGTANYLEAEEGLNVILECAVDGNFDNASFDRAVERYIVAGFALGADKEGHSRDARDAYEASWPVIAKRLAGNVTEMSQEITQKAQERTWKHIENAFRGTNMHMQGMIYTKLKVYYEGLVNNMSYFSDNADDIDGALDKALIGKYNHTSHDECELVKKVLDEQD